MIICSVHICSYIIDAGFKNIMKFGWEKVKWVRSSEIRLRLGHFISFLDFWYLLPTQFYYFYLHE